MDIPIRGMVYVPAEASRKIWLRNVIETLTASELECPEGAEAFARLEAVWPGEERLLIARDADCVAAKPSTVDTMDLVQWQLATMEREEMIGQVINVAGPEPVSWEEHVPLISERLGIPYVDVTLPLIGPPLIFYCETSYEKGQRLLGYQPKHGVTNLLDQAMAMREDKEVGFIPTGAPYGQAE